MKSNHLRRRNNPSQFQRWDLSSLRSSGKAAGSAATPEDSTELTTYQSSRPPEKTSTHTCRRCSSATSVIRAELQKLFHKLQPQSSFGSPGTLARAAASFGDSTEDDSSIPARAAVLPARAALTAAVCSPSVRPTQLQQGTSRNTSPTTCSIPLPPGARAAKLRTPVNAFTRGQGWDLLVQAQESRTGFRLDSR